MLSILLQEEKAPEAISVIPVQAEKSRDSSLEKPAKGRSEIDVKFEGNFIVSMLYFLKNCISDSVQSVQADRSSVSKKCLLKVSSPIAGKCTENTIVVKRLQSAKA